MARSCEEQQVKTIIGLKKQVKRKEKVVSGFRFQKMKRKE